MKSVVNKKAFTIVELIVAMGLLVLLVGLSSVVFSTTVKAHRKATATLEVTRNLRVLAEQLNTDFGGLRTDAPMVMKLHSIMDPLAPGDIGPRVDMIHFFADGDFQTVRQYQVRYDSDPPAGLTPADATRPEIIHGNLARIYYGHANSVDIFNDNTLTPDFKEYHVLSRKTHLLTVYEGLVYQGEIPLISNWPAIPRVVDYSRFDANFGTSYYPVGSPPKNYTNENLREYNTVTLADWINALNYTEVGTGEPANAEHFIAECMDDDSRPYIKMDDYNTLHLLMAQGVLEFGVQWAYSPEDLTGPVLGFNTGIRWWPSRDPDGNGSVDDSDFLILNGMGKLQFGVFFGLPFNALDVDGDGNDDWYPIQNCKTNGVYFKDTFYPKALKFTFVLKDANRMFPEGKTFSHIVSLNK